MVGLRVCLVATVQRLLLHLPRLLKLKKKPAVNALAAAIAAKVAGMVAEAASVRAGAKVAVGASAAEVDVAVNVEMKAVAIVHRAASNAMNHVARAVVASVQPARVRLLSVHRAKADAESAAAEVVATALLEAMQRLHPTLSHLKTSLLAQCLRWIANKTLSKPIEASAHPAKRVRVVVSRVKVAEDVVEAVIAETVQIALKVNVLYVMTQATAQAVR